MVFELKNKMFRNCESYLNSKDVLAGIIFGHLRYFSNQKLLRMFLNEAVSLDNKHLDLKARRDEEDDFEITFWDKTKLFGIPDVYIENDEYDIVVECKYHAKLGENNADKNSERHPPKEKNYFERERLIILLTDDRVRPNEEMENAQNKFMYRIGSYWLSWNRLHYCMKQMSDQNYLPKNEKILFQDLLSFLEKRKIIAFCGIRTPKIYTLNWHYRKRQCFCNRKASVNGGIEMAKNEIAQLTTAHNKLWEDLEALYWDIHRIICDEYKWECFEKEYGYEKDIVVFSYFSGTKVLYFAVNANEGELQLALCSLSSAASVNSRWLTEDGWLLKDFYPFDVYSEDYSGKMPEKLSASPCFDIRTTEDGDWLFCRVALMSLDDSKMNKDVKELLGVMINGKYKDFDQKTSALIFVSKRTVF